MSEQLSDYGSPFHPRIDPESDTAKKELKNRRSRQYHEIDADGLDKIHPLRSAEVWDKLMGAPRF